MRLFFLLLAAGVTLAACGDGSRPSPAALSSEPNNALIPERRGAENPDVQPDRDSRR